MTRFTFLDSESMKRLAATCLLLTLTVTPIGVVSAEESSMTDILTENDSTAVVETQSPRPSALDLSLFGIISLGVLGLFWIRRHTSEL